MQTTERERDQKIGVSLPPLLMHVNGTEVALGHVPLRMSDCRPIRAAEGRTISICYKQLSRGQEAQRRLVGDQATGHGDGEKNHSERSLDRRTYAITRKYLPE